MKEQFEYLLDTYLENSQPHKDSPMTALVNAILVHGCKLVDKSGADAPRHEFKHCNAVALAQRGHLMGGRATVLRIQVQCPV